MVWRKAGLLPAAAVSRQLASCAAFPLGPVGLQAAPADVKGVKEVTSIEGITEYALPNGFRVLVVPRLVQADGDA